MAEYVSRGGDKLASVANKFGLDFSGKTVLDVGSSTGGFTDFALQNGAQKVVAVEKGKNQLHVKLRENTRVEVHEKTDILDFQADEKIDLVVIDLSFVSLKIILPSVKKFCSPKTQIVAMVKPQFEAEENQKNRGVIKNERVRRQILKDFELWAKQNFTVLNKADSAVSGISGNKERFYLLALPR